MSIDEMIRDLEVVLRHHERTANAHAEWGKWETASHESRMYDRGYSYGAGAVISDVRSLLALYKPTGDAEAGTDG